ncbi:MAG: ATP-dependent DNA helicase RecG [Pseudomonadota bacterium]
MRPPLLNPLFAAADALDGIGPKTLALVTRLTRGSEHGPPARVLDVLFHLPSALVDRSQTPMIGEALDGQIATLKLTVDRHEAPPRGNRRVPYRVFGTDPTGEIALTFFHGKGSWMEKQFPIGETRYVSGKVEWYNYRAAMVHPDLVLTPEQYAEMPPVEPVYPMTGGLAARTYLKAARSAVQRIPSVGEWIEPGVVGRENWPSFAEAMHMAHEPQSTMDLSPQSVARRRLAYDEFLASQLALALLRLRMRKTAGRSFTGDGTLRRQILDALPYSLTGSQTEALREINDDLAGPDRMLRLLQGDVGAGKTVVALMAMAQVCETGALAAMMAPTEILARQHLVSLTPMAAAAGLRCAVLTGREKGKVREAILADVASGDIHILLGTHALFQSGVEFSDLGLAVVDEQHRFGVHQRLALASKGITPDLLLMTATPIPRTLVLTYFGDMDVSKLTEKPPGRKPIQTNAMALDRLPDLIDRMRSAIERGDRAYWICPLVEENEELDLMSAENRHRALVKAFGADKVGLVHGRMKAAEKDAAMEAFAEGRTQILVATTVVEVGVDVPEASIMVIEHAERFGLSQLHQLRGRVGRGSKASSCLLLYKSPIGETATSRINIMRETEDGFRIAEEDLRLRGEGEVLGTRQSGSPGFRIANTEEHANLLATARDDARLIVETDPGLKSERGEALRTLLYLFGRDEAVRLIKAG